MAWSPDACGCIANFNTAEPVKTDGLSEVNRIRSEGKTHFLNSLGHSYSSLLGKKDTTCLKMRQPLCHLLWSSDSQLVIYHHSLFFIMESEFTKKIYTVRGSTISSPCFESACPSSIVIGNDTSMDSRSCIWICHLTILYHTVRNPMICCLHSR